jgi:hypothetical protein
MKTTDIPFLRGDVMPEQKAKPVAPKAQADAPKPDTAEPTGLTPAGETTNPEVQQLLAELQSLRANGAGDEADDIVSYLAELGYSAG